jgi:hypothetical protein
VQGEAILLGIDRDRANTELGGGAHHANRDFAAIRDQQTADRTALDEWIHDRMMIALRAISD